MMKLIPAGPLLVGLLLIPLGLVSACAHLDRFANRASQMNVEVADSQNQTLLLNILRAAHRAPMHFTELSTLSGTGTFSGTLAFALPFATLNNGNSTLSVSPSGMISQSPTFNIAVLETQEFYKGMLAPLTSQQMYMYLNEGLPPTLVFALALGQFELEIDKERLTIENNFHPIPKTGCDGLPHQHDCFMEILTVLIRHGLTIEKVSDPTVMGPPLNDEAFKDPKTLKELDAQSLQVLYVDTQICANSKEICPKGLAGLTEAEKELLKKEKGGHFYRIQKPKDDFRMCFDPSPRNQPKENLTSSAALALADATDAGHLDAKVYCSYRQEYKAWLIAQDRLPLRPSQTRMDFTFGALGLKAEPRSTEGVIYFLGEIARCEEFDLKGRPNWKQPECKTPPTIWVDYPDPRSDTLFQIRERKDALAQVDKRASDIVSARWGDDADVAVVLDPTGRDRSSQVLRVVSQLLALNRSAKDFPTPSVLPLITH